MGEAEPAQAGPAECGPYGDRFFEQAQRADGRPSGPPTGTDPAAIDLIFLGGHPRALYTWTLADTTLEVKRLVLVAQTSTRTIDSPGDAGRFTTAPNARRIIFCFGETAGPEITVTKESTNYPDTDGDGVANTPITAPDTATYEITVSNSGNVPVDDVAVTDPLATISSCTPTLPTTLAPGASSVCMASIDVSQSDIDTRSDILNTATGTGSHDGRDLTDSDTFDIPIDRSPAITITKASTTTSIAAPGDIDYTMTVENTGNVTLTNVDVQDADVDTLTCPGLPATLAPGATSACTATTTVDQATIDAGGDIVNTATAEGSFQNRTVSDQDTVDIPIVRSPAITIDKTSTNFPPGTNPGVADPGISAPGDIDYEITVQNAGNVTLTDVTVTDVTGVGEDVGPLDCSGLSSSLAPGASGTCTVTITVDQDRLDAGGDIINTATVEADGGGQDLTAGDSYDVPIVQEPSLTLDKDSSTNPDVDGDNVANTPVTTPGDVDYTYAVTNDGNVTIEGLGIGDTVTTGTGSSPLTVTCPTTILAPGASTTCTATYAVSQADIDALAPVVNTATATATSVAGQDVFATDAFRIPVSATPGLSVTKTSTNYPDTSTPPDGIADTAMVGPDTIAYEIVVTNDGNTTLDNVVVVDASLPGLVCAWPGADGTLQPNGTAGDSVTCTGSRSVDQAEFDTSSLGAAVNVAAAVDATASVGGADFFAVPFDRQPSVALTKASTSHPDTDGDGVADTPLSGPGSIDYQLVLENTGNVTLGSPSIVDPVLGTLTCDSATSLAPGASYTCTGSYTVDQAGFDDGVPLLGSGDLEPLVANIALAGALPPGSTDVDDALLDSDFFVVPFDRMPAVELSKTSSSHPDTDGDGIADTSIDGPGTIDYVLTVENVGNVTLTGLVIVDPDASGVNCGVSTLAPGASTTCSATGTVTQADIDAGGDILNTATATANGAGSEVTDSDTYDIPIDQRVDAALAKTSTSHPDTDGDGVADTPIDAPGPVDYVITGTNTGNVSFTGVTVSDPLLPNLACTFPGADGVVPPGGTVTCTGTLAIEQSTIDTGGDVINIATASGVTIGQTFSDQVSYDIPILQAPGVSVTKTPSEQAFTIGDSTDVTWRIEVVNTGNITLEEVRTEDAVVEDSESASTPLPDCSTTITDLAPGDRASYECTVNRTITEAEFANLVLVAGATSNAGTVVDAAAAVVRSVDDLPETGMEVAPWAMTAVSLLVMGGLLLRLGRRHA